MMLLALCVGVTTLYFAGYLYQRLTHRLIHTWRGDGHRIERSDHEDAVAWVACMERSGYFSGAPVEQIHEQILDFLDAQQIRHARIAGFFALAGQCEVLAWRVGDIFSDPHDRYGDPVKHLPGRVVVTRRGQALAGRARTLILPSPCFDHVTISQFVEGIRRMLEISSTPDLKVDLVCEVASLRLVGPSPECTLTISVKEFPLYEMMEYAADIFGITVRYEEDRILLTDQNRL